MNHNPGLQENRFWLLQRSACQDLLSDCPGRGPEELVSPHGLPAEDTEQSIAVAKSEASVAEGQHGWTGNC